MLKQLYFLFLFICSCSVTQAQILDSSSHSTILSAQMDSLITESLLPFPAATQFSIALIDSREVEYLGRLKIDDKIQTIENHQKVFSIGSITKTFTSTLIADLALHNKVELNDNVEDHLDISINCEPITFTQLANHTSGIPRLPTNYNLFFADFQNPFKDYGEKELLDYLQNGIKDKKPSGKLSEYSNAGVGLLGYLMEVISDQNYEDLLQDRICSKYGMSQTTCDQEKVREQLVEGLDAQGKSTAVWDFQSLKGAGAILSSVEDLVKFSKAHFDKSNEVLELTRRSTFVINENLEMGLGWHIIKTKSGGEVIWHNGATGGYTSSMLLDVENQKAVIILSNVSAYSQYMKNIDSLCFDLMKAIRDR